MLASLYHMLKQVNMAKPEQNTQRLLEKSSNWSAVAFAMNKSVAICPTGFLK